MSKIVSLKSIDPVIRLEIEKKFHLKTNQLNTWSECNPTYVEAFFLAYKALESNRSAAIEVMYASCDSSKFAGILGINQNIFSFKTFNPFVSVTLRKWASSPSDKFCFRGAIIAIQQLIILNLCLRMNVDIDSFYEKVLPRIGLTERSIVCLFLADALATTVFLRMAMKEMVI